MLDRLKADLLTARKARDGVATPLLTALVGEAGMIGKNNGNRETTADECIVLIKKFVKNAEEVRGILASRIADTSPAQDEEALTKADAEIAILKTYLPAQLDEAGLAHAIGFYINHNPGANIGGVMGYLKTTYGATYDGKLASKLAKEALAAV